MTNEKLKLLEKLLNDNNADYVIYTDVINLSSAEEGAKHYGISMQETTPTLILKSKEKYYAAIICGNSRINFKKLKQALNVKEISLADPVTIQNITGAKIGEISLINSDLDTIVDACVIQNKNCYGGCGLPNSTLKINTDDLVRITNASVYDFTEHK